MDLHRFPRPHEAVGACNNLDDVSLREVEATFSEDLPGGSRDKELMALSSSTSAGENAQATCASTLAPKLQVRSSTSGSIDIGGF